MEKIYDVLIIGGGPAGLTTAIYTSRDRFSTLLLEKGICGGLPATTDLIENYPGFPEAINGFALLSRFKEQAVKFGSEIVEFEEVKDIERDEKLFIIHTPHDDYYAKTVVIAGGSLPKTLGIEGELELRGRGVSYCATCDGPLYIGKNVVVIGGGDSALQEALFLTQFAQRVDLVYRRDKLRATRILQEKAKKNKKIFLHLNMVPQKINGEDKVNSVTFENTKDNSKIDIDCQGIFIYIGYIPNTGYLNSIVEYDDKGYIKTDEKMMTSCDGIFAVGDIRSKDVRQISVAVGEGTIAAITVREYLNNLE